MNSQAIGARLRHARIRRGITQVALADLLGVAKTTLSRWETGQRVPGVRYLPHLGDALTLDLNWLILGHMQERVECDRLPDPLEQISAGAGNGRPALDAAQAMNLARELLDARRR